MTDHFQGAVTVLLFLGILGVTVVLHELGHFVVARLAGVRVLEFGVGFPPRARVLRDKGGTVYTLNWLPIGGFVKLEGEDGGDDSDPRSFVRARLPTKMIILVAGVAMNLLTSFLIFTVIAWVATPFVGLRFFDVQPGSPAAAVGLHSGDAILGIDGRQFEFFGEGQILTELRKNAGKTVTLTIEHPDGRIEPITVPLRSQAEIDASKNAQGVAQKGPLGISGDRTPFEARFFGSTGHPLLTAIGIGASETTRWFGVILSGLGDLVGQIATNPTAPPPVAGPVGIATQIADIFFGAGFVMTLYVAGILSANLALVNILPFPPLDGGRMLMIALKSLFGSRISLRAERLTYVVGFVFLFAFLIWVTGFDIVRILSGGS
jgi:regulator of sigma E protease